VEAAALTEQKIANVEDMKLAAHKLLEMGAHAVVVTGGHLERPVDVLRRLVEPANTRRGPHQARLGRFTGVGGATALAIHLLSESYKEALCATGE